MFGILSSLFVNLVSDDMYTLAYFCWNVIDSTDMSVSLCRSWPSILSSRSTNDLDLNSVRYILPVLIKERVFHAFNRCLNRKSPMGR